jgi:DNA end-binding protein Ku
VHKTDCGRVRYNKICEKDGEKLSTQDIVKAVKIGGECIKFTNDELEALMPVASKIMEILGFCKFKEIPVVALSRPYYIGTETTSRGGVGQSFQLLKGALQKSGKVAVVKWVSRTNEYIGMLEPQRKGFLLKQLMYQEQVRSEEEMEVIESEIDQDLVDKGVQVVEKMTFDFDWTKYTEEYTKQVKELLEKKALGEEVEIPELKLPEIRSIEAELEKMLAAVEEQP